jgi:hypothetical protein
MKKHQDFLVVLKEDEPMVCSSLFSKHETYRFMEDEDGGYIVNGEYFTKTKFNKYFVRLLDKVTITLEKVGLVKDGKIISKGKFKTLADVHQYGRNNKYGLKIIFFRQDRELIAIYPTFRGDNKAKTLEMGYHKLSEFLSGDSYLFESKDIQIGNTGIPLSYSNLRYK